jgi:hypothetical protein
MGIGTVPPVWGVLCVTAGDSLKPNWIGALLPPTGPPLAMWLEGALAELMVTELFRACSPAPPFSIEPRTTGGAPATAGTAGVMFGLPFTGDAEAGLPFCAARAEDPTTTGGWDPVAISGVDVGFLVAPAAEAYDVAVEAEGVGAGFEFG